LRGIAEKVELVVRSAIVLGGSWFVAYAFGDLYRGSPLVGELVVFFVCLLGYGLWHVTAEEEHHFRVYCLVQQLGSGEPEAMRQVLMRLNLRVDTSPWMIHRDRRARAEARRLLDEARGTAASRHNASESG
jgi:hypothetical protein